MDVEFDVWVFAIEGTNIKVYKNSRIYYPWRDYE